MPAAGRHALSDSLAAPRGGRMERDTASGVISDPAILGGRPVLRGRRIPVSQLVDQLAGGMTLDEIQSDYQLSDDEVRALLRYIAEIVHQDERAHVQRA